MSQMSKAEFEKHVIKREYGGNYYLKLREEFKPNSMEMHHTMAHLERGYVEIVKTDSTNGTSRMALTASEVAILCAGFQVSQFFWNEQELPKRHVLLGCGCIVNWDEFRESGIPYQYRGVYCKDHEEVNVYRFNEEDFPTVEPFEE